MVEHGGGLLLVYIYTGGFNDQRLIIDGDFDICLVEMATQALYYRWSLPNLPAVQVI